MFSVLLYCSLLSSVVLLSYNADKKNSFKLVVLVIILLSIIGGFRDYYVGYDTIGYATKFVMLSNGEFRTVFGLETPFKIICCILLKINRSPTFLFLVFSFVTNVLIVLRLWSLRKISSFTWMIAVYYIMFYFSTFNIMRQMLGVAILFFSTKFLSERKYFFFMIGVLVASLFHLSCLIGFVFYALELFQWSYLSKKQKKIICFSAFALPIVFKYSIEKSQKYQAYFNHTTSSIGFMLIAKLLLFAIISVGFINYKFEIDNKEVNQLHMYRFKSVAIYYLVGIVLSALSYFFPYMGRIGLPFYIFETAFWGITVKNSIDRQTYRIVIGLILIYYFITMFFTPNGGSGQIPYNFIKL